MIVPLGRSDAVALGVREGRSSTRLFDKADFIHPAHALTSERKPHRAAAIAKMSRGRAPISIARRGGLVVEADLKAALDSGHVAGDALDRLRHRAARTIPLRPMRICGDAAFGARRRRGRRKTSPCQIALSSAEFLLRRRRQRHQHAALSAREATRNAIKPYMKLARAAGQLRRTR